jgi:hypothetical protein
MHETSLPEAKAALDWRNEGNVSPSAESEPTRRKLRRLIPSQLRWEPWKKSIIPIPHVRETRELAWNPGYRTRFGGKFNI